MNELISQQLMHCGASSLAPPSPVISLLSHTSEIHYQLPYQLPRLSSSYSICIFNDSFD